MSTGGGGISKTGFIEPVTNASDFRKGNFSSVSGKQDQSMASSHKILSKRDSISVD